jgi:hypothetical protein
VSPREERNRYLTIFLLSAPAAAIVWFVFHGVYENLSAAERAVGYVDSTTQIGIDLGYATMVGGTLILAAIALWSGVGYVRSMRRDR